MHWVKLTYLIKHLNIHRANQPSIIIIILLQLPNRIRFFPQSFSPNKVQNIKTQ